MKSVSRNMHLLLFLLYSILAVPIDSRADADVNQASVRIDGGFQSVDMGMHWQMWEDASARVNIDALPPVEQWQTSTQIVPGKGFSDSAFWFRTQVTSGLLWRQMLYLQIAYPLLSEVDIYWRPEGDAPQAYQAGLHFPFSARPVAHRWFLFPLMMPANGNAELLVRLRSQAAIQLPATLMVPGVLVGSQEQDQIWLGVAFGVPSIMFCYNLLLFFMVRERSYLYFSFHAATSLYFLLVWQGFTAQFLLPENVGLRTHELAFSAVLTTLCCNLFAEHYLGLKRRPLRIVGLYRSIRYLCLSLLPVLWFLPEGGANVLALLLASASGACVSVAVVMSFAASGRAVRIFCAAWLMLVSAVLLVALNKVGILLMPALADHTLLVAFSVEISLIAFALADRLNSERTLKLHAQETALHHADRERRARERVMIEEREAQRALNDAVELQKNLHQTLEKQVQERTSALETAHQRLLTLYEQDPLTGLKNRRYFSEHLMQECKRARQLQQSLAILLIDMDHFKRINDSWGHLVGDQCIRHLSSLLEACFNRAGDCVARYGGEEFAVLVPHCDLQTALWVAENLRQKVEQKPASVDDQSIAIRVSIGLVVFIPDEKHDVDHYLHMADEALYRAKSAGRNCVCHAPVELPGASLM